MREVALECGWLRCEVEWKVERIVGQGSGVEALPCRGLLRGIGHLSRLREPPRDGTKSRGQVDSRWIAAGPQCAQWQLFGHSCRVALNRTFS